MRQRLASRMVVTGQNSNTKAWSEVAVKHKDQKVTLIETKKLLVAQFHALELNKEHVPSEKYNDISFFESVELYRYLTRLNSRKHVNLLLAFSAGALACLCLCHPDLI
jgi:hypothetical protein